MMNDLGIVKPVGRLENGFVLSRTNKVQKRERLKVRPTVIKFGNYKYWEAYEDVL